MYPPLEGKMQIEESTLKTADSSKVEFSKNKLFEQIHQVLKKLGSQLDSPDNEIESHHSRETLISWIFRDIYGPFLLSSSTKKIVAIVYVVYIFLAVYGCFSIKEGLNPKFLIKESFYLYKFYVLMDETFWREGLQMQVVVNSPPDFFDPKERQKFEDVLTDFEDTQYTMKHNATMFWYDAYERHLMRELNELHIPLPNSSFEWYVRCREWLIIAGGRRLWEKDMVWGENASNPETYYHLYAFRFQLGLRNYNTPSDHMKSAQLMRRLAKKHLEFNITTFHEYYPFADQYLELKPALIRNCIFALFSILVVAFVMIPNFRAAFVITGAILSVDLGLIGYMTFWSVRLESVSMITVIMSIGFAVDLSSHIGYAYVKADGCADLRAVKALETIGWPVFLGAFTTLTGVLVLATVDAYIVKIFFKTTFLVIIFSMTHGLIFLPVFLTTFLPYRAKSTETKIEIQTDIVKSSEILPQLPNADTFTALRISDEMANEMATAAREQKKIFMNDTKASINERIDRKNTDRVTIRSNLPGKEDQRYDMKANPEQSDDEASVC
ncbi:hypothetical protein AB6A40_003879 [Gnathostoma spinigerum]|uniref:Patched family protein n=1 Tax=Gnathostoma spinigerum TaxID=75299 RepID=A0ABD6EC01_9BILA